MTGTAGTASQACTHVRSLPPSFTHVPFSGRLPSSSPASGARHRPESQALGQVCAGGRRGLWKADQSGLGGCLSCSLQRPRPLWPCWAPGPGWEAVALLLWGPTCPCGRGGWRNSFPKGRRLCQATSLSGRVSMLCTDHDLSPGLVGAAEGLGVSPGNPVPVLIPYCLSEGPAAPSASWWSSSPPTL